jgi:hypothetical protein
LEHFDGDRKMVPDGLVGRSLDLLDLEMQFLSEQAFKIGQCLSLETGHCISLKTGRRLSLETGHCIHLKNKDPPSTEGYYLTLQ